MSVDIEAADGPSLPPPVRGKRRSFVPGLVVVILGIALVVLVWRGARSDDRPVAVTIVPSRGTASLWTQHTITAARSDHPYRMTVSDDQFRVNSTAVNADGNQRELWSLDRDYSDVDVTVRIDQPSSLGGDFKPQPGIALRYHDDGDGAGRALIIDGNIWSHAYDRMILGVWKWPVETRSGLSITQISEPLHLADRKLDIVGVSRRAGDPATDVFSIDPPSALSGPFAFRVGDPVDISTTVDRSYARKGAEITAIDRDDGLISVRHPGKTAASPFAVDFGAMRFRYSEGGIDPRALYPRYVRARIVGSTVQAKSWLVEQPEPGWQVTATIPARLDVPATGRIGLVTNHLHGAGRYLAFGPVTIRPVTTP